MFYVRSMSTRVVRSISDFLRHGLDVDVECYCGHKNTLDARRVYDWFRAKGHSMHLEWALGRFRCTRCGSAARHIGPRYR